MDINKELLVQAIELHLKGRHLDACEFNTMLEYAPLIAQELILAYSMSRNEFHRYVQDIKHIDINKLRMRILNI